MSLHVDSSPYGLAARVLVLVGGLDGSLQLQASSNDELRLDDGSQSISGSPFSVLMGLAHRASASNSIHARKLIGYSDEEQGQVSEWTSRLESGAASSNSDPAHLVSALGPLLRSRSFLAPTSFTPSVADYTAWAIISEADSSVRSSLPREVSRWLRAVSASIPRSGDAAQQWLSGTPLLQQSSSSSSTDAPPQSEIFNMDVEAAVAAAEKKNAGGANDPAGAAAAGGDKKKAAASSASASSAASAATAAAASSSSAPASSSSSSGKKEGKAKESKAGKEGKDKKAAAAAAPASGEVSQIYRIDFRIGAIKSVAPHPTEARLYVCSIDIGEPEPRQVVAGLADHFTVDDLTGKRVVLMVNLKSGDLKGVPSNGRCMVATSPDGSRKEMATPPEGAAIGERITFASVKEGQVPDAQVAPKRLHEIMKGLHTNSNKVVQYLNDDFMTSAGPVTVPTIADGTVA